MNCVISLLLNARETPFGILENYKENQNTAYRFLLIYIGVDVREKAYILE